MSDASTSPAEQLVEAAEAILDCCELNLDEIDDATAEKIDDLKAAIAAVKAGVPPSAPTTVERQPRRSAHTPGPWTIYEDERPIIMATVGDENYDVCELSTDRPIGEILANARLIKAAPDMRKASQELYDRLQEYLDVSDGELVKLGYDELVNAMDELEAAWHMADGTVPEQNHEQSV